MCGSQRDVGPQAAVREEGAAAGARAAAEDREQQD